MKFLLRNLIGTLTAVVFVSVATVSLAKDDTSSIAEAILKRWVETTVSSRTEEVVAMYTSDALFYGSAPELKSGKDGVASYFQALPKGGVADVVFYNPKSARVSENTIIIASYVDFHVNFTGTSRVLEYRIMLTLVKGADGNWLIAGHHAAPRG